MSKLKVSWVTAIALTIVIVSLTGQKTEAADPQWQFSIVAIAPVNTLSDPALDLDVGSGTWQVAFTKIGPALGGASPPRVDVPGLYLQEIGSALRTIAKPGDPTPSQPGYVLCFGESLVQTCPLNLNYRVSLSQGTVAFIAASINVGDPTNPPFSEGVYVGNGLTPPNRIADTTMPMHDSEGNVVISPSTGKALTFQHFGIAPSIYEGLVAFKGASDSNVPPTFEGIYVDFGSGPSVIADQKSDPTHDLGYGAPTKFITFDGEAPTVSKTNGGTADIVAFAANVQAGSKSNIRGIYTRNFTTPDIHPGGWVKVADSVSTFPYNETVLDSPSISRPSVASSFGGGQVAFNADIRSASSNPTGIYAEIPSLSQVATTGGGGGGAFRDFGIFPSIDSFSLQPPDSLNYNAWVGFSANVVDGSAGIYLLHEAYNLLDQSKVIDAQGVLNWLAPILHFDPTQPISVDLSLFHEAVKNGAITFRASLKGQVVTDVIILARPGDACAMNVDGNVSVTRSGFQRNRYTKRYVQQITLKNTGNTTVQGPVSLVLDSLSSNATLFNSSGNTSCSPPGSPYANVVGSDNKLAPSESVSVVLEFTNTSNRSIMYSTRVLTGATL